MLKLWIVSYSRGSHTHATGYEKDQCFGVNAACRLGPDADAEVKRVHFNGRNWPTCKVCRKLVRQIRHEPNRSR